MKICNYLPNIREHTSSEKTEENIITTSIRKEASFILNNEEIEAFEKFVAIHNAKKCFIVTEENDTKGCFSFTFTFVKGILYKRVICLFCGERKLLNANVQESISETTPSKSNW